MPGWCIQIVFFLLLTFPLRTSACECDCRQFSPGTDRPEVQGSDWNAVAAGFHSATAVFEGVLIVSYPVSGDASLGGLTAYKFRVLRVYKGSPALAITVISFGGRAPCSLEITPHRKYLIYAVPGDKGRLAAWPCSRTAMVSDALPDLRYLRHEPPKPQDLLPYDEHQRLYHHPSLQKTGASLSGAVLGPGGKPPKSSIVSLWYSSPDGKPTRTAIETKKIGPDGRFDMRFVPPGDYFLTAESFDSAPVSRMIGVYRDGGADWSHAASLHLQRGADNSHIVLPLRVQPLAQVTVRIESSDGEPPPSTPQGVAIWDIAEIPADISKLPSNWVAAPYDYQSDSFANGDGVAEFKEVPYGRYQINLLPRGEDGMAWEAPAQVVDIAAARAEVILKARRKTH
ncbi:MAG: hypothetical protein WBE88_13375 [Candidatus Acidiferrales bacterium]